MMLPMRHVARHAFTALAALSLLLCLAACVLWVRSYWAGDRVSAILGGQRHAIRSEAGGITIYAPPTMINSAASRRAQDLVAAMTNRDLQWYAVPKGRTATDFHYVSTYKIGAVAGLYRDPPNDWSGPQPPGQEVVPALQLALEDPQKCIAAHVVLADIFDEGPVSWEVHPDRINYTVAGLHAELKGKGPYWTLNRGEARYFTARVDLAQFPALRERWRRRLEVPIFSFEYWRLVAASLVLPLVRTGVPLARKVQSARAARRRGLCPACGYDLRASPGRCPECGAEGPGAGHSAVSIEETSRSTP